MPRLKANFEADAIACLRSHLVNVQGWSRAEVAALDDRDVRFHYFDARRRRIVSRPRTIKVADDFLCPPTSESGWNMLQHKVQNGADINPHLSRGHASLLYPDGLLAEWSVHHFHLGVVPDPKDPAYIERTGPLLYAFVTDNAFCAINIYGHKSFENSLVLESIHRNWPDMISRYRAVGVTGGTWSQAQRRALRSKNANVFVATADGTVYGPIGGGVMASGVNAEAVRIADAWLFEIRNLQIGFEKELNGLLPTLRRQGYAGEDELEAELRISDGGIQVFFTKYHILANVTIVKSVESNT